MVSLQDIEQWGGIFSIFFINKPFWGQIISSNDNCNYFFDTGFYMLAIFCNMWDSQGRTPELNWEPKCYLRHEENQGNLHWAPDPVSPRTAEFWWSSNWRPVTLGNIRRLWDLKSTGIYSMILSPSPFLKKLPGILALNWQQILPLAASQVPLHGEARQRGAVEVPPMCPSTPLQDATRADIFG